MKIMSSIVYPQISDLKMRSIHFGDFGYVTQASNQESILSWSNLKCKYMALDAFAFQKHNSERGKGYCNAPNSGLKPTFLYCAYSNRKVVIRRMASLGTVHWLWKARPVWSLCAGEIWANPCLDSPLSVVCFLSWLRTKCCAVWETFKIITKK